MGKRTEKWFSPGKPIGWHKDDAQKKRVAAALESRRGNALKAARALQALANVTTDPETKKKTRADAETCSGCKK